MRNLLITISLALALCGTSFAVFYYANDDAAMHHAAREGDAMKWLRTEFKLNDQQFAAIQQLHDDYSTQCADHCAAIMAARRRASSPAEIAALEKICVDAMTRHFQQVAALMPPKEGQRYLATVLPRIADYDHHRAPNLQATH